MFSSQEACWILVGGAKTAKNKPEATDTASDTTSATTVVAMPYATATLRRRIIPRSASTTQLRTSHRQHYDRLTTT